MLSTAPPAGHRPTIQWRGQGAGWALSAGAVVRRGTVGTTVNLQPLISRSAVPPPIAALPVRHDALRRLHIVHPDGPRPDSRKDMVTRTRTAPDFTAAPFAPRHNGPTPAEQQAMLEALGYASLDAFIDAAVPGEPSACAGRWRSVPARTEHEVLADLRARWPAATRCWRSYIGMGYHDTHHAAGDPAQHPGEPGLVHGLHAVPGRDRAGPPRGAAQLPDDGQRPDRPADRERLAARRGHRRRRGDGDGARASRGGDTRNAFFVADGLPSADDRGGADARRGARRDA